MRCSAVMRGARVRSRLSCCTTTTLLSSSLRVSWRRAAVASCSGVRTCRRAFGDDVAANGGDDRYPIVQLPSRSLLQPAFALSRELLISGEVSGMMAQLRAARHYYQYPSLSAPQIGWNVQAFVLFDDRVYVNAVDVRAQAWARQAAACDTAPRAYEARMMAELRRARQTCFAWEPCASCCYLLHYIERPLTVQLRGCDEHGNDVDVTLDGLRARMAQHELDHMQGLLFTRRVVDTDHVVPLAGFTQMSDWSDDFPSLEARSTYLYTLFTPPYTFATDTAVDDANLLDRHFEDGVYPGAAYDLQHRLTTLAQLKQQRERWRSAKARAAQSTHTAPMPDAQLTRDAA